MYNAFLLVYRWKLKRCVALDDAPSGSAIPGSDTDMLHTDSGFELAALSDPANSRGLLQTQVLHLPTAIYVMSPTAILTDPNTDARPL